MRQASQQPAPRTIQVQRPAFRGQVQMDPEAERISNLKRTIEQLEQRLAGAQQPYPAAPMMMHPQAFMQAPPMQAPVQPAQNDGLNAQLSAMRAQIDSLNANYQAKPAAPKPAKNGSVDRLARQIAERQAKLDAQADQQKASTAMIDAHLGKIREELGALQNTAATHDGVRDAISHVLPEGEIARMSSAIDEMRRGVKFDSEDFQRLEEELANLRTGMKDEMATAVAPQVAQLEELARNIDTFGTQAANSMTPRVDHLADQIDALRLTVDDLPQTLAVSRLDSRLSELSEKLDAMNRPSSTTAVSDEGVAALEGRLDEISRALVAVSNMGNRAPQMDMTAFDRMEARMSEIGRTVDALSQQPAINDDLGGLATRIDGLNERLGSFEKYAEAGDLGGASSMFASPDVGLIEEQLKALNTRIDEQMSQSAATGTIAMERQLDQLAARVEEASATHSTAAQMSNLEAQLGQLVRQMGQMPTPVATVDFAPVEHRLGQIENRIDASHAATMEAAQHAAQQAVSMMGQSGGPDEATATVIAGLSDDLRKLQQLSEADQNARHEDSSSVDSTLQQIVNRLSSIETAMSNPIAAPAAAAFAASAAMPETLDAPARHNVSAPALDPYDDAADQPLEPAGHDDLDYERMVDEASRRLNGMDAPAAPMAAAVPPMPHMDAAELPPQPPFAQAPQPQAAPHAFAGDEGRPDAVAAARRALQATTAEMNAVRDEVKTAGKGEGSAVSSVLSSFDLSRMRKPLIMGASAILLAIAAFVGVNKFVLSPDEPVMAAAPAIESSTTDLAALEAPASDVTGFEVPITRNVSPDVEAPVSLETEISAPAAPTQDVAAVTPEPAAEPRIEAETAPADPVYVPPATAAFEVPSEAGNAALVAAAAGGDAKALYHVGMRYSEGTGVTRDMATAGTWFERSAETGYAPAQYSIGSMYEKGLGREKDIAKAASWYDKAAQQGNARAMHNLAVLYAMGKPPALEANMDKAVSWFQKAAALGIQDSQFNLGILYGQGRGGTPQDLSESYKWFALASKAGDTDAANKRDEVANAMDPSDLESARKIVNDWAPGKLVNDVNRAELPAEWDGAGTPTRTASAGGNPLVRQAQSMLNQRGYNVGRPDGLAGPNTRKAVREFQRSAGLKVTGQIDKDLMKALDI